MKTKVIINLLVISCLCLLMPMFGQSQEILFRAYAAEIVDDMPALSCFASSCASARFRNDFCTKEMLSAEVGGVLLLGRNVLLLSVNHYGYSQYGSLTLATGYGRNFGDRFAITARVFYLMAHARGYPASHSLSTDIALACKVSSKLLLSSTVYNPFMLRYGIVKQEVIPMRFSVGCTYMPTRKLLLSLSISKTLPGAWEVAGRFMTQPVSPLLLAADCSNTRIGLLVAWIYKRFVFSIQAAWHYRISVSPEIGTCFYPEPVKT